MSGPPPGAPPYGERTLAELLPSVIAALVGNGPAPLRLTPADRGCVLLVDGLGLRQLEAGAAHAPHLSALLGRSPAVEGLVAGFPATTATSLASLGTGLPPGTHGMLGYEVLVPGSRAILNSLRWDPKVDPLEWQPRPTCFDRADALGLSVTRVGPGAFARSGLTRAALRGGRYLAAESPGERVAAAVQALKAERALVYVYYSDLDATGHRSGVDSPAWRLQLEHVDRLVEQFVDALPPRTSLWITGDHGMVDVSPGHRVDLADEPGLRDGVAAVTGEARARYVHATPGAAADVLAAWQSRLGESMWVFSRDEAIERGWFGPVTERVRNRIGDVVAAAHGQVAVVDSARERPELLRLVGLHGSLTEAESLVPLVEYHSGG